MDLLLIEHRYYQQNKAIFRPHHLPERKHASAKKMQAVVKDVMKMSKRSPAAAPADSCCSTESITPYDGNDEWITGEIHTPKGSVPVVSTNLRFKDMLGAWKVRWGIGRMNYKISPGFTL
jgi:hypothetical protein